MQTGQSHLPNVDLKTFHDIQGWDEYIFWNSYRDFFEEKGYTLYELKRDHIGGNYTPVYEPVAGEAPVYSFFSRNVHADLDIYPPSRHLTYAQDRQKRDVVIKMVETDSVEHRIHLRLMSCTEFNNPETFPYIITTLDVLPSPHNFSFVIMPRWGDSPYLPEFRTAGDFLSFIENILQGLAFLHSRRIAHLDIDFRNILLNQFTHTPSDDIPSYFWDEDARASLRINGQMRYCLFDFDLSQMFPLDASINDCHVPIASVRGRGAPDLHPKDVQTLEPDLDPFKFDVACMGNMLRMYNSVTPSFPFFAPLLDRMATDDVAHRFTAYEALSFCRFIQSRVASEELEKELHVQPMNICKSPDPSPECSTKDGSGTSGSTPTCSERELDNSSNQSDPLHPLPSPEPTSREKDTDRWKSLPVHFVAKWSIGGQGWIEVDEFRRGNPVKIDGDRHDM